MYYSTSMPGYGVFWKDGKGLFMSIEEGLASEAPVEAPIEAPIEETPSVEVTE